MILPEGTLSPDVIVFSDQGHFEYIKGKIEHSSDLVWKSCSKYLLISRNASGDGFWQPGDTLTVEVLNREQDTLTLLTSARGASFEMKMIRLKK